MHHTDLKPDVVHEQQQLRKAHRRILRKQQSATAANEKYSKRHTTVFVDVIELWAYAVLP